ncbi:hypothetical protein SO802_001759 [Lithocarpus litseifolius]|uniref:PB1-like domain-containing protein n=1 Tax=Lithocarpus litseifolius TaxID=425828 RepID=A0AAW2DZC6_9ROSI
MIDCFFVLEVKNYCAELGVLDYIQFYYLVPGLDLDNGLRYLSIDADTHELFKCLIPIDPKIDIYVEHATPVQKQLLVRDVSVVDVANLIGCGVGVEGVGVVDIDGDCDDNEIDVENGDVDEVDVEDGDEALADDEFEEGGNVVNEGNDARGKDENGAMGDVDYEWYDSDYDDSANEQLYEITVDEVDDYTIQPIITHNNQPSQEPTNAIHPLSHPPNFANQSLSHLDLVPTLFNWPLGEIPSGSDYASSDQLHSFDNSDGDQKKKLLEFRSEYLKDLEFVLGMSFRDNKQFIEFTRAYKLKHGYGIKLLKNEKSRVRYKCFEGCPWKVSVGIDKEANFWISALYDTYTCNRSFHSRQVSAHWVAENYVDQFRINIEFQVKDLVAAMGRDVNVELAFLKAYRARDIARGMVKEDFCEQYTKGVVAGQLLVAMGIDGNDGMYPIAYAIVEVENKEIWTWFVENLIGDIGPVRHLFANFKKNHQGNKLKDLLWGAAKASTSAAFESYMKQMEIVSKEACDELRGKSLLQWARHAFPYYPKCDMLLNNLCETFNSKIVEAREKSLVNMLETIRRYLMVRIRKHRDSMAKYQGPICHKIQQKMEKYKEASIDCKSIWSGGI